MEEHPSSIEGRWQAEMKARRDRRNPRRPASPWSFDHKAERRTRHHRGAR